MPLDTTTGIGVIWSHQAKGFAVSKKIVLTKNYSVEVPGRKPVVIRTTSTLVHAVKHACFAAELQIRVSVRDNRTDVIVTEFAPIDDEHAIKPKNKRDRRYARMARKAKQERGSK